METSIPPLTRANIVQDSSMTDTSDDDHDSSQESDDDEEFEEWSSSDDETADQDIMKPKAETVSTMPTSKGGSLIQSLSIPNESHNPFSDDYVPLEKQTMDKATGFNVRKVADVVQDTPAMTSQVYDGCFRLRKATAFS